MQCTHNLKSFPPRRLVTAFFATECVYEFTSSINTSHRTSRFTASLFTASLLADGHSFRTFHQRSTPLARSPRHHRAPQELVSALRPPGRHPPHWTNSCRYRRESWWAHRVSFNHFSLAGGFLSSRWEERDTPRRGPHAAGSARAARELATRAPPKWSKCPCNSVTQNKSTSPFRLSRPQLTNDNFPATSSEWPIDVGTVQACVSSVHSVRILPMLHYVQIPLHPTLGGAHELSTTHTHRAAPAAALSPVAAKSVHLGAASPPGRNGQRRRHAVRAPRRTH